MTYSINTKLTNVNTKHNNVYINCFLYKYIFVINTCYSTTSRAKYKTIVRYKFIITYRYYII